MHEGDMRKRQFITMLLASAAIILAGAPVRSDEPTKVTIAYGFTSDFLPAMIAQDKGFFAKHGLDATLIPLPNSALAPATLQSDSAQIAQATPPNLVLAVDGGLDLVAVAAAARLLKSNPRTSLVTRNDITVTKPQQLTGMKIAVPGINSGFDLNLKKWLIDGSVPPDLVTIIETPFPQMGDRLKGGQIDGAILIEPLLSHVLQSGAAQKSVDILSQNNPDQLGVFYLAKRDWATAHPRTIQGFRAALAEGIASIAANPDEAKAIEVKYLHSSEEALPSVSIEVKPSDFAYYIAILQKLRLLQHPVDAEKLIFN
jgi:NitT/TauT family transport system substrate-binding protein